MNIVKPCLILLASWVLHMPAYAAQNRSGPMLVIEHGCTLKFGGGKDILDLSNIFVPADLPIGGVIGTEDVYFSSAWDVFELSCYFGGEVNNNPPILFSATNLTGLDPIGGTIGGGAVLKTNIPGVGIRLKMGWPWRQTNGFDEQFTPETGEYIVPYKAHNKNYSRWESTFRRTELNYTLIKTGNIAPGLQPFDGSPLFSMNLPSEFAGPFITYGLRGSITQAQCSLGSNPVSADPVELGDAWTTSQFVREGYTTTAVPFSITLLNCEDNDPGSDHRQANINITLDAVHGAANALEGVANLTPGPLSAVGLGVQILMADGRTPMPLNTEIELVPITIGTTVLNFQARYYQTGTAAAMRGGEAKSAVNYTITYK